MEKVIFAIVMPAYQDGPRIKASLTSVFEFEGAQIYIKFLLFFEIDAKADQSFWHWFISQLKVVNILSNSAPSSSKTEVMLVSKYQSFNNLTKFLLFSHLFLPFNYAYLHLMKLFNSCPVKFLLCDLLALFHNKYVPCIC